MNYAPVHTLCSKMRYFLAVNFWPKGISAGRCAETSVFVTTILIETFPQYPWRSIAGTFSRDPDPVVRTNDYHCWTTDDKIIIDLTADQFDTTISDVLFVPVSDRRYLGDCTNPSIYAHTKRYLAYWREAYPLVG